MDDHTSTYTFKTLFNHLGKKKGIKHQDNANNHMSIHTFKM